MKTAILRLSAFCQLVLSHYGYMKLADMPRHTRPREKLATLGAQNLREAELLAILLRTGYRGKNAVELAERILRRYPLVDLLGLPLATLTSIKGIGPSRAAMLQAVSELALLILGKKTPRISCPDDAVAMLQHLKHRKQEYLIGIYLNARREVIAQETITIGTIDASLIHPREVFAPALSHRASCLVIAHNHPSGDTTPSLDDVEATEKLVEAGEILDIHILDHVIIADDSWTSLRQQHVVEFRGSIE